MLVLEFVFVCVVVCISECQKVLINVNVRYMLLLRIHAGYNVLAC